MASFPNRVAFDPHPPRRKHVFHSPRWRFDGGGRRRGTADGRARGRDGLINYTYRRHRYASMWRSVSPPHADESLRTKPSRPWTQRPESAPDRRIHSIPRTG